MDGTLLSIANEESTLSITPWTQLSLIIITTKLLWVAYHQVASNSFRTWDETHLEKTIHSGHEMKLILKRQFIQDNEMKLILKRQFIQDMRWNSSWKDNSFSTWDETHLEKTIHSAHEMKLILKRQFIQHMRWNSSWKDRVRIMMFNANFNNISAISWQSVLLMEETRVPVENHWPAASHWQTMNIEVVKPLYKGYWRETKNVPWKWEVVLHIQVHIICSIH
jgi:hypothetical protein